MKKNSRQTKAQEARQASFRVYKKAKKMRDWIRKNGGSSEERDEMAVKEWLESNEVKVCPPFGHNDPWGNSTTNKRSRGPLLVAGRRVPPRKVRQENN